MLAITSDSPYRKQISFVFFSLSKVTLRYDRGPSFDSTEGCDEENNERDVNGNNVARNSGCGSFTNEVFSHFREITNSFVEVALTDHDELIESFKR